MILTLPEAPSANRWWRKFRNRMVLSQEARAYKETVAAQACAMVGVDTIVFPKPLALIVRVEWHRARKAGDLDKRLGVVLDALQGSVYENDGQIEQLHAFRSESPRQGYMVVQVNEAVLA